MKALIGIGLCATLLSGCAALPGRDGSRGCSQQPGRERELQMNMTRDMIREGRPHAALTNLRNALPGLLDVHKERALILRRISDPRVRAECQALPGTYRIAKAHHDLGLFTLRNSDNARTALELHKTACLRSIENRFRNNLGAALFKRGDRVGARSEFITALELQQGGKLPTTNLLGLLCLQGGREDTQRLTERLQLSAWDARMAEARTRSWGAVPTPGTAPASDDPLAELLVETNIHAAMANEASWAGVGEVSHARANSVRCLTTPARPGLDREHAGSPSRHASDGRTTDHHPRLAGHPGERPGHQPGSTKHDHRRVSAGLPTLPEKL